MADLENMISDLLKDPNSMKLIGDLVSGLGEKPPSEPTTDLVPGGIDAEKIACLVKNFNAPPDERCRLLLALKPFLCPERQKKVEQSIRILKLIKIAESMGGMELV